MSHAAYETRIDQARRTAEEARAPQPFVPLLLLFAAVLGIVALAFTSRAPGIAAGLGLVTAVIATLGAYAAIVRTRRLGQATALLGDLARADAESGLLATHALWGELPAALARSRHERRPLAVVLVSFEGLSEVYIERGFSAGQQLLRQIGQALEATTADHGGRCYRAHGSAFIAVLEDASLDEGERIARKLGPVLRLLEHKGGGHVRLEASAAIALPGDVAQDVVQRAERRCHRRRLGNEADSNPILKPVPTH